MLHQRVTLPTGVPLDVYAPASPVDPDQRRRGIIICPGGGYTHLSMREAEPVALRFAGMGFVTFVVWYHVAPAVFPTQVQDVACAVAHVRSHAAEYHADSDALAVMGFSAGAHVACTLGVMWQDESLWQPLGLTPEQVRPNAMVLGYPVITGGTFAHRGSFVNLTGSEDLDVHARYSWRSTSRTPRRLPSFGTPGRINPCPWRTRCSLPPRCTAAACRARRTSIPTAATAQACAMKPPTWTAAT